VKGKIVSFTNIKHKNIPMKLIFLIIPIVTILISCDTIINDKTSEPSTLNSNEISTSTTFEGKYQIKHKINDVVYHSSYLFFQNDGFVYVNLNKWSYFNSFSFKKVNSDLPDYEDELPCANFYKYEKHGTKIYINLGEYGYYGLDCSNPNELVESNPFDPDKEHKWIVFIDLKDLK
jgi:hypothetical protein